LILFGAQSVAHRPFGKDSDMIAPLATALTVSARADPAIEAVPEIASQEDPALAMEKAVARRAVLGWEGVGDDLGNIVPVSPEGTAALLEIWPVCEAFQTRYVARGLILLVAPTGAQLRGGDRLSGCHRARGDPRGGPDLRRAARCGGACGHLGRPAERGLNAG
jgi:hypothetical protein